MTDRSSLEKRIVKAMLVDPSLFTAPYDAALTNGLLAAGVEPVWMIRPKREADRQELPIERTDPFFYRRTDDAGWLPARLKPVVKGVAHVLGLIVLLWKVGTRKPDVVHFQWVVIPPVDVLAMALIRLRRPVILTVHDTVPFNGERMSWLQRFGHDGAMRMAHRVIVHTLSGRASLVARGVPSSKIVVIPHGALSLPPMSLPRPAVRDARWTFVLFGEIKPYKGLDVLIEAVAALSPDVRHRARVVVAGRPRMDVAPLAARIAELGMSEQFDLRLERLSEEAMATLFAEADSFVFPYRQIDASGVYFLVKSFGKWLIASRVGIFAEDIVDGVEGALVPSADVAALAGALHAAILARPPCAPRNAAHGWAEIGVSTRALYRDAMREYGNAMPDRGHGLVG